MEADWQSIRVKRNDWHRYTASLLQNSNSPHDAPLHRNGWLKKFTDKTRADADSMKRVLISSAKSVSLANQKKTIVKKVTGIGGIFFKCEDKQKMKEWYAKHLGIEAGEYGGGFEWREKDDPEKTGFTAWNPFPSTTKYFDPSKKDFMINYRVDDLEALVAELKQEGVTIVDEIATYDYGKFVHILDAEGNAIELWQPM